MDNLFPDTKGNWLKSLMIVIGLGIFTFAAQAQEPKQIRIHQSDKLLGGRDNGVEIRRLIGNVTLSHDSAWMYCDSAYLYTEENRFVAYSNVRMEQGDTLYLYGDTLYYQGDFKTGRIRNNVVLIDQHAELNTNFLDFNFNTNISHYFNGGTIIDSSTVLVSQEGYYYSDIPEFRFQDEVELTTPDYFIKSDTLVYNTEKNISRFFGPTEMIGDSSYIYSHEGYYNTDFDIIKLGKNSFIQNKESYIEADSIFYNKGAGFGKAFDNVFIEDTIQQSIIKGNYLYFHELQEFSMVTDSAVYMLYDQGDTLYLHADTLYTKADTLVNEKVIQAYHKVKFYRYDMQGKCDSLNYNTADSLIRLYHQPILWNEGSQLTAEFIQLHLANNSADRIDLERNSMIITEQDSLHYDQIAGKNMIGFIANKELYKIKVNGNAQTIYFPSDEKGYIGCNKAESSKLIILMDQGQVRKLNFLTAPSGIMSPIEDMKKEDKFLKGYKWLDDQRPKNKLDIFIWE